MDLVVSWWNAAIIFFHYNLNVTQFYPSIIFMIVIRNIAECLFFCPCLIPCSHLWISALIESCCNYLLSPLTACSGGPLTLALKNGDGKWLPLVSFILGSSWLLFGVQVIFEKQGSSIKTTYAADFFWSCIVSFLMQSLTSSAHAGYSAVPRPV